VNNPKGLHVNIGFAVPSQSLTANSVLAGGFSCAYQPPKIIKKKTKLKLKLKAICHKFT
jgi:hypothetical protein